MLVLAVLGCTPNEPWRQDCLDCQQALIVKHQNYDLAFVEFTERGNLFDRSLKNKVVDHVAKVAQSENGVTAVVFVHGWKNNADVANRNIADFRGLLQAAAMTQRNKRRVVGIYVGWRGLSVKAPVIKELTYWERKTVAEQVGRGGVTELLLELEHAISDGRDANKNVYLVTGHSFGAGIVLSALNEILLDRVVTAPQVRHCNPGTASDCACVETRPFGHGVVLLNPAIEANEAYQLKEAVADRCFGPNQVRLMHVISSDADRATNKAFRVGQWLGTLNWRKRHLDRELNGESIHVHEHDLDTTTIGNYLPFQTGQLCSGHLPENDPRRHPECRLNGRPPDCIRRSERGDWDYISYVGSPLCVPADDQPRHIPVAPHEPLAFIQTDDAFIGDHNDVFKPTVAAYLAAIVVETQFKRARSADASTKRKHGPDECYTGAEFDFGSCFDAYGALFKNAPL